MAPSATSDIVVLDSKVGETQQPEKHVHGAEDKTPLEAISHGPLIHPGENPFPHINPLRCDLICDVCAL